MSEVVLMAVNSYRDLHVWRKAMNLVEDAYRMTRTFPKSEIYGLASQLQRSAVSVPANIAEGHGRGSTKSYLNHLSIANGSLMELETHILLAERLQFCGGEASAELLEQSAEVGRMLRGLQRSLSRPDS